MVCLDPHRHTTDRSGTWSVLILIIQLTGLAHGLCLDPHRHTTNWSGAWSVLILTVIQLTGLVHGLS